MPIATRPDHVAIAVPAVEPALARWRDDLGGRHLWSMETPAVFRGSVLAFRNGAQLEMLEPSTADERTGSTGGPTGFLEEFLARFGPRVHHVTLKVDDLLAAVGALDDDGIPTVDVDVSDPHWHEAFVPPSVVGGMIVQIAATDRTSEEWAAVTGSTMPPLPTGGAALLGPRLRHDDLDQSARVWRLLGGHVERTPARLLVSWPDDPLTVEVDAGDRAAVVGLRFAGGAPRPSDDVLGPAVIAGPG